MSSPKSLLVLLSAMLIAIPGSAQDPKQLRARNASESVTKSILRTPRCPLCGPRQPSHAGNHWLRASGGAGLGVVDGELWGVGAAYKVRFSPEGFELTPALGAAAQRNMPLRWHLASIGRDGAASRMQGEVTPAHDGLRVEYARGGVRERYDVCADGIEQSFVFDALPPGDGDLIVRGRIECELALASDDDGLRLELPGAGGIAIGGVTGIDADGRTAEGALRCRDGAIELSLPRAFVDAAALPLTLDPPFTIIPVSGSGSHDLSPDVAYDLSNDLYLSVWERSYSLTDSDVIAAAVPWGSSALPYTVPVTTGPARDTAPSVGNVNTRNAFVVAWERDSDIVARSVRADDGAVSPEAVIAGGAASQSGVDVGGNAVPGDDDAVCVWLESQGLQRRIMSMQVQIDTGFELSFPTPPQPIAGGLVGVAIPTSVKISKSGGPAGPNHSRFAVVYAMQDYVRPTAGSDVRAVILNRNAVTIAGPIDLAATPAFESLPDVDGDGDNWIAAWNAQTVAGAGTHDVCARAFSMASGRVFAGGPIATVDYAVDGNATIGWTGQSCLIGTWDTTPQGTYTVIKSVDLLSCARCESTSSVFSTGGAVPAPGACASALSGGATTDDAMVLITTYISSGSFIDALSWQTEDGVVQQVAAACGDGGTAHATCARIANAQFAFRLIGAAAGKTTVLLLSGGALAWSCGACALVPDPSLGVAVVTTTDADGSAVVPVAIPSNASLRGVPLYEQWLTVRPATPACPLLGVDMSSATLVKIE